MKPSAHTMRFLVVALQCKSAFGELQSWRKRYDLLFTGVNGFIMQWKLALGEREGRPEPYVIFNENPMAGRYGRDASVIDQCPRDDARVMVFRRRFLQRLDQIDLRAFNVQVRQTGEKPAWVGIDKFCQRTPVMRSNVLE